MRRTRFMPLAAALVLGAAGCGGSEERAAEPVKAQPVGEASAGYVMQYADCGDWKAGTRAERMATVEALRDQLSPQGATEARSPISDERAYAMFERSCAQSYAESLRLYKLYARAQSFSILAR